MGKHLDKNQLTEKLNIIFKNRFDINLFDVKLNITLDDNVFGKKINLVARDLIYLVHDVEEEFNITITDDDIDNIKFNTIGNIITVINKELEAKEQKDI